MKCLWKKLAMFIPLVLIIGIVNVIVDPANIYKEGYEAKAAELLISGKNVVGMTNYDERILQQELIIKEFGCPDTILLGSSRIMTLSDDVIKSKGTYRNHGVSGAGLFDYLGILGIYVSCDKLPKTVILGLDPWVLNENNGETRYRVMAQYINEFEKKLDSPEIQIQEKANVFLPFEKKMQLLSIPYFQSSVKLFLGNPEKILSKSMGFYGTDKCVIDESIRYADGSIDYPLQDRQKEEKQVNIKAREFVAQEIYQVEEYDLLNKDYCTLLEKIIDYLQKERVDVTIYLPPYHPYVYKYLSKSINYRNIFAAEEFFLELAEKKRIYVYGSYNPKEIDCTSADFLDGMHLKRASMGKTWKRLIR